MVLIDLLKMAKPQFDIRTLLVLTAAVGCGFSISIRSGHWLIALLVTLLLTNVLAVIVALVAYVVLPVFENVPKPGECNDVE